MTTGTEWSAVANCSIVEFFDGGVNWEDIPGLAESNSRLPLGL